jgi:glutathione S-transferase
MFWHKALAKSKPLRDKFLGEMDKKKGFSVERLKQAEDSISKTVKRMENPLSQSEYLLGKITLADFAVLPSMIRMEDLGYEFLWKDCPGVAAWMVRMKKRRSYSAAYYEGSLLSQQYPGIREEHQARRALALANSPA